MVNHQQQHVLVGREPEHPRPQRRFPVEREPLPRRLGQPRGQLVLADLRDRYRYAGILQNPLVRPPIPLGEHRAQGLVPCHDILDGRLERGHVEPAGHPPGHRDVVGGVAALQLMDHPQPLLGVRQRNELRPLGDLDRTTPPLPHRPQSPSESRGCRGLEHLTERDVGSQRRPDPAHQAHGQQRMPTEREEVVVHPDPLGPQHPREEPAHDFFARVPGLARHHAVHRHGQRAPVELPGDRPGQRVQLNECPGNHVFRQPAGGERTQLRGVQPRGVRDHVGDQATYAGGVLADDDGSLGDGGVSAEHGFDFAGLDSEASEFHLVVGAAEELQGAVRAAAGQVAGAVEAGAGNAEGVGDEAFRRQGGTGQVAAGQPFAGEVELTGHTDRDRSERTVENVGPGVGDGSRPGLRAAMPAVGVHGTFGRAVQVVDHGAGEGAQAGPEFGRGRLATHRDHPRAVHVLVQEAMVDEFPQVGRGQVDEVDLLLVQVGQQGRRVGHGRLIDNMQLVPGQQPEQRLPRPVEAERGRVHRAQRVPPGGLYRWLDQVRAMGAEQVGQPAMRPHDTLWSAGGPRGIDHISGGGRRRGLPLTCPAQLLLTGLACFAPLRQGDAGHPVREGNGCRGEHAGGGRFGEHVAEPVGRVGGVERQIRRPGGEHAEDGGDHLGPGERQSDHGSLALGALRRALVAYQAGDGVDPGGEFGEGQGAPAGDQGDVVGPGVGGFGEEFGDASGFDRPSGGVPGAGGGFAFLVGEDFEAADRGLDAGGELGQQGDGAVGQGLRRVLVAALGGVLQEQGEVGDVVDEGEVQVELGGLDPGRPPLGGQAEHVRVSVGPVVVPQHDLK